MFADRIARKHFLAVAKVSSVMQTEAWWRYFVSMPVVYAVATESLSSSELRLVTRASSLPSHFSVD